MNKKAFVIALLPFVGGALILGGIYGVSRSFRRLVQPSQKLEVVATIYPLAEFAQQVGGELVQVKTIVPPGQEPHDYEPTLRDVEAMYRADVVLVNGGGIDAWADRLVDDLRKEGVRTIRVTDELGDRLIRTGNQVDPHVWLDPSLASQMTEVISWPLFLSLGRSSDQLMQQKDAFTARLATLDEAYRTGLARCERRDLITSHEAFQYLAKRYQLTLLPIQGISPEEDPSPQRVAELITAAKQRGVTTVFFETSASSKAAETIARELGIRTAVLHPLEGLTQEDIDAKKGYLEKMEENLVQLRTGFSCS